MVRFRVRQRRKKASDPWPKVIKKEQPGAWLLCKSKNVYSDDVRIYSLNCKQKKNYRI
jgi:hypothetical protein